MTIRVLILDDDASSRKAAGVTLEGYPEVSVIGQFGTSGELMAFLQNCSADLLFLDIELDSESGFEVAKQLRGSYPELMIVFLTGHSSYAVDGYDFQPVNFLTKPINRMKLEQTLSEVRRRMERRGVQQPSQLMFRLMQGYRIVDVRDICYFERENRKNFLHLPGEFLQISGYTMRELEEMLSPHGFFLCHQSFIISLYRVQAVRDIGRQVYEAALRDCLKPIPVSRNRYEILLKQLNALGIPLL